MQNIEFRNKQHLLRRKIIVLGIAVLCWSNAFSQFRDGPNLPDHDSKPYHFGINLGYNRSHFLFTYHPYFLQRDTIMDVESVNSSGINLAWLVNFRMGEHFDLRLHPLDLTFSEKTFLYSENFKGDSSFTEKKVSSITLSFPVHIKLKKGDMSVEVGLGFHFYFPVFVLTPEIKLSSGLVNLHSRDESLRYSNVIDKINSKMITFSLTVE